MGRPGMITPEGVFVFMLGVEVGCWFVGFYFSGVGRSGLGFVLGRGVVLVWRDRMREGTAYTSFCRVLAPKFRQTTSSDRRCLGAECDRDNAHQLLSEHKTICAEVA